MAVGNTMVRNNDRGIVRPECIDQGTIDKFLHKHTPVVDATSPKSGLDTTLSKAERCPLIDRIMVLTC